MRTPQQPIGSGFGYRSTAAEVIDGIDLSNKLAIVTGGYSGLGLETVRALVGAGAHVVVPARRRATAEEALAGISGVEIDELDLGDQASVKAFAERFLATGRPLDLLINNAGIMALPETRVGPGWEAQFATNHLGHFTLTNLLWPRLVEAGGARVVALSSRGHKRSGIRFDDLMFEHGYDRWEAYGQAKTANCLFAVQLDALGQELRRPRVRGAPRADHDAAPALPLARLPARGRLGRRAGEPLRALQDARAGGRHRDLGRHEPPARRHGRRLLRELRHRRGDRSRLGHGGRVRGRQPRDRPRDGGAALGRLGRAHGRRTRSRRCPRPPSQRSRSRRSSCSSISCSCSRSRRSPASSARTRPGCVWSKVSRSSPPSGGRGSRTPGSPTRPARTRAPRASCCSWRWARC